MKVLTSLVALAFVLSIILTVQALATEKEAAAWGLPEGFNPAAGKIENQNFQSAYRVSKLMGTTARDARGNSLGRVDEILFTSDGRISYLVLTRRGETRASERVVPIPWEAAKAGIKQDRLVLSIDRSTFDKAPSLARNELDKLSDPELSEKVHAYYETEGRIGSEMMEEQGIKRDF